MRSSPLPPEFEKACLHIDDLLANSPQSFSRVIPSNFCCTNKLLLTSSTIGAKDLPSGHWWTWNQSKGKKDIVLTRTGYVGTIRKLIPRRRKQEQTKLPIPKLKVWHFELQSKGDEKRFSGLWCERGEQEKFLSLEDFAFLAEFTSVEVSQELWPSLTCK